MQLRDTRRVACIHDISTFGRCSLSVILPVLSAIGVQALPIPTAVLSTHTGGLGEVAFRDLTEFIPQVLEHYKRLELEIDCIYTGFLGSQQQIDHCLEFFEAYPNALAIVDPVMGDHGKAYKTCTADICSRMTELVRKADIITPNLTEACMLLKTEYDPMPLTRAAAKSMLVRLSELGPDQVVITGVQLAGGEVANIGYDRPNNTFWEVSCDYVPVSYPGTGDIFAGVLTGAIMTGDSLPIAMSRATQFLERAIKTTFSYGTDTRHGVMLESAISILLSRENQKDYKIL
ncbi:MAG: pyridoxamine kinase [Oscillospiraceae bacterium]|nr:pyridoxamine kinase [Oscillospiraceae bacterium]